MAERPYDVDTVDVADVSASCWAENTCQRCVSDAGAAVLVFILDVAVSALVINRESGVMRGSPAKLRVYHPQGRMATDSQDLHASLNLILGSGSNHWPAVEYPASTQMLG
jgi:hypothetical protein